MAETYPGIETARQILNDVYARTGKSYKYIESIPTSDKSTADLALPVLARWVDFVREPNIRGGIFRMFSTPYATPFVGRMLEWFQREDLEPFDRSTLAQGIAKAMRPDDAEQVWAVLGSGPKDDLHNHIILLSKLATFSSTSDRAIQLLLQYLTPAEEITGTLELVAKIDDPRIRAWFASKVNDSHPVIRRIARRVANQGKALPKNLVQALEGPDPTHVAFGTEADADVLQDTLETIANAIGFTVPPFLSQEDITLRLKRDIWYKTDLVSTTISIWLRLEDIDTIEIAVTVKK